MPWSPAKPCAQPGCPVLTHDRYCEAHAKARVARLERGRQSSTRRGYDYRWQKAARAFLAAHPLCQCPECDDGRIRVRASEVVDHKIPHRGDRVLFWDPNNWQAMAKACHDRKTATEDGRWGWGV